MSLPACLLRFASPCLQLWRSSAASTCGSGWAWASRRVPSRTASGAEGTSKHVRSPAAHAQPVATAPATPLCLPCWMQQPEGRGSQAANWLRGVVGQLVQRGRAWCGQRNEQQVAMSVPAPSDQLMPCLPLLCLQAPCSPRACHGASARSPTSSASARMRGGRTRRRA